MDTKSFPEGVDYILALVCFDTFRGQYGRQPTYPEF